MEWLQPLAHAVYWSFPSLTEWRIISEGLNCCKKKKRWCSYNYFFVIIMTVLQYYCHCISCTCNEVRVRKLNMSLKLSLHTPLSWDILWPDIYMRTDIVWLIYVCCVENNVCWLVHQWKCCVCKECHLLWSILVFYTITNCIKTLKAANWYWISSLWIAANWSYDTVIVSL